MTTPEAVAGPIHPAACIKITGEGTSGDGTSGDGTYKIVPYQAAVDTYADAYTVLHIAIDFDTISSNSDKQTLLHNISNYFNNAIRALQSTKNAKLQPTNNATLLKNATKILSDITTLSSNPVPAAAATAAAAPAAAAATALDKKFLLKASDILFNIAQVLAPPTNVPKTTGGIKKGGRRKRNTRHKHRKNKNKTRVGRR